MQKNKLLISFSGGETSAYMTKWLWENMQDEYEMQVVFANTGREREETLYFVHRFSTHFKIPVIWVEAETNPEYGKGVSAKVVDLATASRNGQPFEAMIAKHGIPNIGNPNCSRELKRNAIRAYARQIGWRKYYTAIGIRIDEIDRMSTDMDTERLVYPLATIHPKSKPQINLFWVEQPFRLELKSYEGNCIDCWKKSLRKLLTIKKEQRQAGITDTWSADMEAKYGEYIPDSKKHNPNIKTPIRFCRSNISALEVERMSHESFAPAKDEKHIISFKQMDLDEVLDMTGGCIESCEAF